MPVMLDLSCGGCDATERVGPLVSEFRSVSGRSYGIGSQLVANPRALCPDGWVMFDPYTGCTYCPTCWASIIDYTEPST